MRFNFSIKRFFGAFTLLAVSGGGLVTAGPAWAATFYTAAFVMILCGITAAILRRESSRAYWVGFAIFATGYFVMATLDEGRDLQQPAHVEREPSLVTTRFLLRANSFVSMLRRSGPASGEGQTTSPGVVRIGDRLFSIRDDTENFVRIGDALFTLLLGLLGGAVGRWCYRDQEPNCNNRESLS
jgi:hypothetical protein